ncbi:MAG: MBL fold metallo-hydrolase [Clostridiaceae bacterium]
MIEKVYENPLIYRIEVPLPDNPLKYLNSYILPEGERPCIIDTGFNRVECWESLKEGIDQLKVDLKKTDLFITHLHSDHMGLAYRLFQEGCTIYMNPEDYNYFLGNIKGDNWSHIEDIFCQEGFPREEIAIQKAGNQARIYAAEEAFPIVPVEDGETVTLSGMSFVAINTPGHTKGHTCLYLPGEEIMFTADHILFDITPNITPWLNLKDSLKAYENSLNKISTYTVKRAFPSHRTQSKPFSLRIEELKVHHRHRLEEMCRIISEEPALNAYEISARLKWSMRGKSFEEFSPSQKWFAVGEAIAHLNYLLNDKKVEKKKIDDVYSYYFIDSDVSSHFGVK